MPAAAADPSRRADPAPRAVPGLCRPRPTCRPTARTCLRFMPAARGRRSGAGAGAERHRAVPARRGRGGYSSSGGGARAHLGSSGRRCPAHRAGRAPSPSGPAGGATAKGEERRRRAAALQPLGTRGRAGTRGRERRQRGSNCCARRPSTMLHAVVHPQPLSAVAPPAPCGSGTLPPLELQQAGRGLAEIKKRGGAKRTV